MIPVSVDSRLAYINSAGKIILKTEYEYGGFYSEGLAVVGRNKLYGCIDQSGSQVIPLEYDNVGKCSEGFCRVMKGRLWGLLHRTGDMTVPFSYAAMGNCSNGLVGVQKESGGKIIYVDSRDNIVIKNNGTAVIVDYAEGFVASVDDRRHLYGYRDAKGKWAITAEYTAAMEFSEGCAAVNKFIKKKELTGFINIKGGVILPFEFWTTAARFRDGLAIASDIKGNCGAINKSGSWIIKPEFYYLQEFSEGLALSRRTEKSKIGFIDTYGVNRIDEQYITAFPFKNDVAKVRDDQGWAYVNKEGAVIWRLTEEEGRRR